MKEVHMLAIFVHGSLASLHALGIVYNLRKKNRFDTAAHVLALLFSLRATDRHIKHCKEGK